MTLAKLSTSLTHFLICEVGTTAVLTSKCCWVEKKQDRLLIRCREPSPSRREGREWDLSCSQETTAV